MNGSLGNGLVFYSYEFYSFLNKYRNEYSADVKCPRNVLRSDIHPIGIAAPPAQAESDWQLRRGTGQLCRPPVL